ncbi:MAG: LuxR C-terminal-related transcriptional regulator [Sphingomonas sp.]|uniref:helix-turn-helix transcriptional regulator n=1 Tax=Sphingomonas sp. TaxID=28214 RepID=UPI002273B933|nr:LuxR C-terminal-related transcriptional regulator [Sphingomonas sp.]MCX8477791.1 LuxR C-terminal-related transcriptional regulator [Sphingomonas sp.]
MLVSDASLSAVRVDSPAGIRAAAEALRDTVRELAGLRVAVTHNIAAAEPMKDAEGAILASEVFGFTGEDSRWWRFPQLALTSPLPMACRFESEPFWCNAEGIRTHTPNALLAELNLANFRERALTSAAIVAPIHLPFGQIAAASFLSPDPAVDDLSRPYEEAGETLALLARVFVASYVKVTERRPARIAHVTLSKREVECLRWAAAGKTNDEIAMIVGLKRTTIRFHIRAAAQKLDAVNRDQALFKAAQLGFLSTLR